MASPHLPMNNTISEELHRAPQFRTHSESFLLSLRVWPLPRGGPCCQEKEMKQSLTRLCNAAQKSLHAATRKALATKSEESRKRALEKKVPMSANVNTAHESTETEMETSEEYCAMQFVFDAMEGEAMFEYDHLH
jgi:hypothetical protein